MPRGDKEIFNCKLSFNSYTRAAWLRAKLMREFLNNGVLC